MLYPSAWVSTPWAPNSACRSLIQADAAWIEWSPYTYPFNLTQQPAASVPGGLAGNGLPIGVQIVGPPRGERTVLRAARVLEQAMPMPRLPV